VYKTFSLEHPGNTDSSGVSLGQTYLIALTMENLFRTVIIPDGDGQKLQKQEKSSNSKSLNLPPCLLWVRELEAQIQKLKERERETTDQMIKTKKVVAWHGEPLLSTAGSHRYRGASH